MDLSPVIVVDEEKCVNCHACIAACPVKHCIDGSGDHVTIRHNLCIGCGSCIEACTHGARTGKDDFAELMKALERGEPVVAVAAPAVASNFSADYLRLNGLLHSMGIEAVFDVSFGAELTVKSYLEYVKRVQPRMVIAQPCPAIVTYMEIYMPEMLTYMAPADSPMMHAMKMIRSYYPAYTNHKIAVISPCYAKRREFDEVGIGDFNVTMKSLAAYIKEKGIELSRMAAREFANPPAERAVLFSSPGGLLRTVEREMPDAARRTRKIEGPHVVYDYFRKLPAVTAKGMNPLLVDCLNCELGCNGGPGTLNQGKSPDETEFPVEMRRQEMEKRYRKGIGGAAAAAKKLDRVLRGYWNAELYARRYVDRSSSFALALPTEEQKTAIAAQMLKFTEADYYNCSSCGYGSCNDMIVAIANGLNKPENCHYYKTEEMKRERVELNGLGRKLHTEIDKALSELSGVESFIRLVNEKSLEEASSLEESSAAIEQMMASIGNSSRISSEKKKAIDNLVGAARSGEERMLNTVSSIEQITKSVQGIREMIDVINSVASHTNLLSMNAAIEAAHAGDAGKGFAVVAGEIRRLAETTAENARRISGTLKLVIEQIGTTSTVSSQTATVIHDMIGGINGVAGSMTELINSFQEMSMGSGQITTALGALRKLATEVKSTYGDMLEAVTGMQDTMQKIGGMSEQNIRVIGTGET